MINSIDEQTDIRRLLNTVLPWQLSEMITKYPALKSSWNTFIMNYNMCLAAEPEQFDDIPF